MNVYLKRLIKLPLIPIAIIFGMLWAVYYFLLGMVIAILVAPIVYLATGKDAFWWWAEGLDWYFNLTYRIERKIDLL